MPDDIPKVQEIGATSAPLMSASFFIGDRCRAYNDDYMKCKEDANGRGELECLKEGRKVTRCAASVYVTFALWTSSATKITPEHIYLTSG
jgi:NADH dehydrogenase (ubiquinone) 1 alpha subcomplex subunit 8